MKRLVPSIVICLAVTGCATSSPIVVRDEATAARLDRIIVPEVDFRSASISDVIAFLHICCLPIGYDPPPLRQVVEKAGVTYFVPVPSQDHPDVRGPGEMWEEPQIETFGPSITLSRRQLSLLEVYRAVADLGATSCEIRENMIVIKTRKVQPSSPPYSERAADDPF